MNTPDRKAVTFEDIERHFVELHRKPYFDWLRHVVTLALAALTALVTLQGHYVPIKPKLPVLIAVGWVALAVAIFAGLFALKAEYTTPLAAAKKLRERRATIGDAATAKQLNRNSGTTPGASHRWAVRVMVSSFTLAVIAICAFAIANLQWI